MGENYRGFFRPLSDGRVFRYSVADGLVLYIHEATLAMSGARSCALDRGAMNSAATHICPHSLAAGVSCFVNNASLSPAFTGRSEHPRQR